MATTERLPTLPVVHCTTLLGSMAETYACERPRVVVTSRQEHESGEHMAEVVVVTGIGGMGMACARRLGPGRHLVLADFNADKLAHEAEVLTADGFAVTPHVVDVSDLTSVVRLAATAG